MKFLILLSSCSFGQIPRDPSDFGVYLNSVSGDIERRRFPEPFKNAVFCVTKNCGDRKITKRQAGRRPSGNRASKPFIPVKVTSQSFKPHPNDHPQAYCSSIPRSAWQFCQALPNCEIRDGRCRPVMNLPIYCWTIIRKDDPEDYYPRPNLKIHEAIEDCTHGNEFSFKFGYPGYYDITVTSKQTKRSITKTYRVLYARREVRDLTPSEWDSYVKAVWTLKSYTTAAGRKKFGKNCPSGNPRDYKEYDHFVAFQASMFFNQTCEQFEHGKMQEFAGQAFATMFEKSLQCVEPSTALHYWNAAYDQQMLNKMGIKDVLYQSIFNDAYYGGGRNYDDINEKLNEHMYVTDGHFFNFPLRNNRMGLCEDFEDSTQQLHCFHMVQHESFIGPKNFYGFISREPKPKDAYNFVSRRPGYIFHRDDLPGEILPSYGFIQNSIFNKIPLSETLKLLYGPKGHNFGHNFVPGVWGLETHPKIQHKADNVKNSTYFRFNQFINSWEKRMKFDNCSSCSDTMCSCHGTYKNRQCWDDELVTPNDGFQTQGPVPVGSYWANWLSQTRGNSMFHRNNYACMQPRSGTMGRNPFSCQDPVFFAFHSFLHALVNLKLDQIGKWDSITEDLKKWTEKECSGHGFNDVTVFANIVPYLKGQTPGQRQTWSEIFNRWEWSKREFRYDYEGVHGLRNEFKQIDESHLEVLNADEPKSFKFLHGKFVQIKEGQIVGYVETRPFYELIFKIKITRVRSKAYIDEQLSVLQIGEYALADRYPAIYIPVRKRNEFYLSQTKEGVWDDYQWDRNFAIPTWSVGSIIEIRIVKRNEYIRMFANNIPLADIRKNVKKS